MPLVKKSGICYNDFQVAFSVYYLISDVIIGKFNLKILGSIGFLEALLVQLLR